MYQLWILMQNNRCKQVWMDIFPYFKTKGKKKKKKEKEKGTTVQIKTWKTMNALEDGGRVRVSITRDLV